MQKSDTPGMFSEIASRYDLLNHLLSLSVDWFWRRDLVRLAGVPRGGCVLDVCTGTGDVAIGFAQRVPEGRVWGVDLSAGMLAVARRKLARKGLADRLAFVEGDALHLPFGDGSFDAVTVAFGLRNLPDYARGVAEMARVLRPGGRLLVLEFCPPSGGLRLRGYNYYLQNVLPAIGGLVSGSRRAYRYLATSIGGFLSSDEVGELMASVRIADFEARKMTGGIAYIYHGRKSPA